MLKKKTILRFNLVTLYFLLSFTETFAQTFTVSGRVEARYSTTSLPFVHIIVNNNEAHTFADADGAFRIEHPTRIKSLTFKHYQYRDGYYNLKLGEDSIQIQLNKYTLFEFEDKRNYAADRVIENVILRKKENDTESNVSHSFETYNKLVITTDKVEEVKKVFEKSLKFLGIKLKPFRKDHHLVLIESVTEKRYLNDLNQRENIIASKFSGIDEPSIYTLSSILLPSSIYSNYVSIASLSFLSPLNDKALDNYHFRIVDTALVNNRAIYAIKFTPAKKNANALKGMLYVDNQSFAITNFTISPAYDSPPLEIFQSFSQEKNRWFPDITRTNYVVNKFGKDNIKIDVIAKTFRSNLQFRNDLKLWNFNDVILKYEKKAADDKGNKVELSRKEAFTRKDTNTYAFYDTIGSIKKFERFSTLGEGIYNGIVPIKKINIEVDRLLSANEYEGFRIGIGGYTNDLLSDRYSVGGYIGYGTHDGKFKYGIKGNYIIDKKTEFALHSMLSKDLMESGGVEFFFDRYQYSTENLRKYRIRYIDRLTRRSFSASIKPVRYVYITTALNFENIQPTYAYMYREDTPLQYQIAEYGLGLKLALGEQFIRSPQNKFLLPPKYPLIWLEFRKGFTSSFFGKYDYKKIDLKFQYSFKKPGIGKQTIQIIGGLAQGNLPYFKLYNMTGSWKTFSVVIHNSFETMLYNEFLSDRYVSIHYAHDLGRIYIRKPRLKPGLEILHNFGVGTLKSRGGHKLINFKTMEKGYMESGLFIYDILTLRTLGVRTGLGTGVFMRYGPYARENLVDNFVYKLGLSFSL